MRLQFPATVQRETVTKGREPRAQTVITFFSDTGLDETQTARVRAAADIVENKLRDILREQLGGTYSVSVGYSDTAPQPGYGTTTVQFGSSPENVEKLSAAVLAEVERLRRDGPTAGDLQIVKEADKNDLAQALRQNAYWLNALQSAHLLGRDAALHSAPRRAHRCADARERARGDAEVPAGRPLHRRDADARGPGGRGGCAAVRAVAGWVR